MGDPVRITFPVGMDERALMLALSSVLRGPHVASGR